MRSPRSSSHSPSRRRTTAVSTKRCAGLCFERRSLALKRTFRESGRGGSAEVGHLMDAGHPSRSIWRLRPPPNISPTQEIRPGAIGVKATSRFQMINVTRADHHRHNRSQRLIMQAFEDRLQAPILPARLGPYGNESLHRRLPPHVFDESQNGVTQRHSAGGVTQAHLF